jgi:hypothetical protein
MAKTSALSLWSREEQGNARRHPVERSAHRRRWPDISARVRHGPRRHRLEAHRLAICKRPDARLAEGKKPGFRAAAVAFSNIPPGELERFGHVVLSPCHRGRGHEKWMNSKPCRASWRSTRAVAERLRRAYRPVTDAESEFDRLLRELEQRLAERRAD